MSSNSDSLDVASAFDDRTVYSIVRIALIVIAGLVLLGLVSLVPGIETLLAHVPVRGSALLLATGTYLLAAGLLAMAPRVGELVSQGLDGPDTVVEDASASAAYLIVFAAILLAARGFAPAVVPLLEAVTTGVVYDLAFMLAALVPVLLIARRMYRSLDPIAELVTRKMIGFGDTDSSDESDVRS